jgi:hypothetical protein
LSFHGMMAQIPVNDDIKIWAEDELFPFLSNQYRDKNNPELSHISDDANTMLEMLRAVESSDELAAEIVHTMEMRQSNQTLGPIWRTLAFSPSNIAMLLITHHKSHPNHSITELLHQARYDMILSV